METFPTIRQRNAHDCGYACVNILAAYHGLPVSGYYEVPQTHLSIRDITDFAARAGFSFHAFRTSYAWLFEKVTAPYIVHFQTGHFVVVYGMDRARVRISDPASGTLREMTKQEFVRAWLGLYRRTGSWKGGVVLYLEKPRPHAK